MSDSALPSTKDVVSGVFTAVSEFGRQAGELPTGADYLYHTAFPGFRKHMQQYSTLMQELMDACCVQLPKRRRTSLRPDANLSEDQRHNAVMEAVDSLLENVDSLLDEVKGNKLRAQDQLSVTFGSELGTTEAPTSGSYGAGAAAGTGRVVARPQLAFEFPVDNSTEPFRAVYFDAKGVRHVGEPGIHPFAQLIGSFKYTAEQLAPSVETPYLPLAACEFLFVDTVEDLEVMCRELLGEKEISVDLEHHDYYSYQGFTCLMQISTRAKDYVIDCLKLRSSMHQLAPVFLSPGILKVFHGAQEDVRWLQKDFGLYVVNMFDTGIALQTLHMPHSLAFAVDHFCQVKLNKKYQTADWRLRPLPAEMVSYARQDTHFLLYCYDRLKSMLLNNEGRAVLGNLLLHVLNESRQQCLLVYEKPTLDAERSYKLSLGRSSAGLTATQLLVAKKVFNWRDAAAREVDDSPASVMHLSSVLSIATKLPLSTKELLACCSPASVTVRKHLSELVAMVREAIESSGEITSKHGDASQRRPPGVAGSDRTVEVNEAEQRLAPWEEYAAVSHQQGWYRPMTGALPSIENAANAPVPAVQVTRYHPTERTSGGLVGDGADVIVWEAERSPWLLAMQRMAEVLRSKVYRKIAVPGSDTVRVALKPQKVPAPHQEPSAAVAAEGPVQEAVENTATSDDEAEDLSAAPAVDAEVADEASTAKVVVPEGAVSLRQLYGTGNANRRGAAAKRKR